MPIPDSFVPESGPGSRQSLLYDTDSPPSLDTVTPTGSLPGRFISLGAKLAVVVVALLMLASLLIARHLSAHALDTLIHSKATAAGMVADLFAASVAPAVDFGDEDTIRQELENLEANQDVLYAATWSAQADASVAEIGRLPVAEPQRGRQVEPAATRIAAGHIELVRPILGPTGKRIGAAVLYFTLAPENAEYRRTRRNILLYSFGLAAGLAVLVLAGVRLQIVRPLNRLYNATRRVRRGKLARVEIKANDELGRLGEAFNAMASAIVDREQRLAAAHRRIQELVDHMRQGIVVFGRGGVLERVRSRQADAIFAASMRVAHNIVELLYPGREDEVETRAFREWVAAAFDVPYAAWEEISELAPSGVVLQPDTDQEAILALEFVPIPEGETVSRIMVLVTDETSRHRLEQAVREQEEQHARQMSAMRRLVAGGGQLLVSVLDGARERLATCNRILGAPQLAAADVEAVFRAVHTVKGEARSFDLAGVEAEAARIEDGLAGLRRRLHSQPDSVTEFDRAQLLAQVEQASAAVSHAADMLVAASPIGPAILEQVTVRRRDLARLLKLTAQRNDELARVAQRLASRPFGESVLYLGDSVSNWAEREGKRAQLVVRGRQVAVPPDLAGVLPGVLTHLVRNAISHGLERVEEREAAGKHAVGMVRLEATEQSGSVQIVVEDDGRGLDAEAIVRHAEALGLRTQQASLQQLAFADGLTTANEASQLAGRGVGLSAVRADLSSVGFDVALESGSTRGVRAVIRPRHP